MEDILHLYSMPVNKQRPVVCFDELPVQLLGEVVTPLAMKTGKPKRVDYEYERGGTCSLLVAFEPLTGRRLVETSYQRTKADYCRFMQRVNGMFPAAESCWYRTTSIHTMRVRFTRTCLPPKPLG